MMEINTVSRKRKEKVREFVLKKEYKTRRDITKMIQKILTINK